MFTVGLPVYLNGNEFWMSEQGLIYLDGFLTQVNSCSEFDQIFIFSSDTQIQKLAQKHQIKTLQINSPFSRDVPYIFEETQFWANELFHHSPIEIDEFAIIDHRNLQFSDNGLKKMLSIYDCHRSTGVISLSPCYDHPCQLRLYSNFLGCCILKFSTESRGETTKRLLPQSVRQTIQTLRDDWSEINICITMGAKNSDTEIFIDCQNAPVKEVVAHVLPYDSEGPLYNHFANIKISCSGVKTFIKECYDHFSGAIITLLMDDCSGGYDTVEFFTPQSADWELGLTKNEVVNKTNHIPIQGRQQFSPVYSYDGSFYASYTDSFLKKKPNPMPIICNPAVIITDWVEYYRYMTMHSKL